MKNLSDTTVDAEWPKSDLEFLGQCAMCGSKSRTLFFDSLRDRVFGVAPGRWTLWKCNECHAAYLDPRPTEKSIGRAYCAYYTHTSHERSPEAFSWTGSGFKGRLKRGYLNQHYGHHLPAAFSIGLLAAAIQPRRQASMDLLIRHLPPPKTKNASLLDVGCGNGAFLLIAKDLGYSTFGLEPDDTAAQKGREAGLNIRNGSLPNSGLPEAHFEHIMLNHVFEHLHRPREAAAEILRLLEPGGRAWFSQPNLESEGLKRFGQDWMALDPPRHLSLYNFKSFTDLLKNTGFEKIELLPPAPEAVVTFPLSFGISEGIVPISTEKPRGWNNRWQKLSRETDKKAFKDPCRAESFTVVAFKPE